MQPGNPGRFLQHRASILRLGGDQRANASLADHPGGVRPGRQIGEQRLHVPRADLLAIHTIFASRAPLDPPNDLQLRLLVERRRHRTRRIVEGQADLGQIARRTARCAGEDHIVHLAGTQRPRALLAHRPAQRLDDVGFAAAVRAHNAGETGVDFHADRFGKALEPGDANAAKMHGHLDLSANLREL